MKIRNGFVSNSSSSSFVIRRRHLTPFQLACIKNYKAIAIDMEMEYSDDSPWDVNIDTVYVTLTTNMDNFDMYHYLVEILGVDQSHIKMESY